MSSNLQNITRAMGRVNISKKREFWKELSEELGGDFKVKSISSNTFEKLKLTLPHKGYKIVFTESDTQPLKIQCVLKSYIKLLFTLYPKGIFEKILKFFGKKDVEIGDPKFDQLYLISSNNSYITKELLSESKIKTLLLNYGIYYFSSNTSTKTNELELSANIGRNINKKSELNDMFSLFCLIIDKLASLNVVSKNST